MGKFLMFVAFALFAVLMYAMSESAQERAPKPAPKPSALSANL